MVRKLSATVIVLAVLASVLVVSALAIFTDTASVLSNTFSTGTVDIGTTPTSALFTVSNMAPGDSTTQGLTVSNNGSLALRYAVTSTTTENTLAAQLDLTIWDEAAEGDAGTTCNATAPGTVLYGPADLGSTTGINVIGNPAQGAQAGDRTLASGASEVLCFRVALPLSTGNSFQNTSTEATFSFQAEQTANN